MIPTEDILKFQSLTKFNLSQFFERFYVFILEYRLSIQNYYSGVTDTPDYTAFKFLDIMLGDAQKLNGLIEGNKSSLNSGGMWELVETVADMRTALQTIENSSRWLRSAISKNNFNPYPELERVTQQMDTLEKLAQDALGSNERDEDWVNIALDNSLREEDYNLDGGVTVKVQFINGAAIKVDSVVDNIQGENIYGKDIDKIFAYESDDVRVLTPNDTIKQAVGILASLRRGDNPEFDDQGIQSSLILGVSGGSIAYPVLFRNWVSTFSTDDTLQSFKVSDMKQEEDIVKFEFKVETRIGEILETSTEI